MNIICTGCVMVLVLIVAGMARDLKSIRAHLSIIIMELERGGQ